LAQQMLEAEAMNWQMKGSQALLHGLSPGLLATERSLDLYIKNQETDFSSQRSSPFFSQLLMATEGGPENHLTKPNESKGPEQIMSASIKGEGGGSKMGSSEWTSEQRSQILRQIAKKAGIRDTPFISEPFLDRINRPFIDLEASLPQAIAGMRETGW